ncbi:type III-A CRISPR-associated RAMP protein Csm4 [Methanospirillum stamsii]|uniref:CRISPR system Cms protein Csm4 n=1 Tax=Methanospirillum stamsii TaxID=1277351 RepID=A0A2V2MW41_9EURY|nr:type III-A CRISPR-associated RAMP protein Csm4 [Methanospirillum stamsii]PWR70465.1 type III-A CRISPR-associated RAMP protein Csm4 [Methanospirillum stamsii]
MQAVYLKPCSTFPATIHSNTLFGAICRTMDELGYDTGGFIERFSKNPPLEISSCFPYIDTESGKSHLFPMPHLPPTGNSGAEFETLKKLKKIQYVDEQAFMEMVSGVLKISDILTLLEKSEETDSKIFSRSGSLKGCSSAVVDIPHNQINRLSSASEQFFHTSGMQFHDGGLFFLIRYHDRDCEEAVHASLRLMADRGIGQRVSSGQGHFDLSFGEIDIPDNRNAPYLTTLSRFMPRDISPFGNKIWYDLVTIRGRSTDGVMKKRVMMLGEGSVFSNVPEGFSGQIATVRSDPPVIEYGLPFLVGMGCLS